MKFTPIPLMLLCCTAIGSAHAAEDWLVIPATTPNLSFAIDKNSLERNGSLVKFWEKLTYAKPEIRDEVSGYLIVEKKMYRVIDCAMKTQGLIHGATYGEHGRFITSISVDEDKVAMGEIPPNTIAASELALVCEAARPDDKPAASRLP